MDPGFYLDKIGIFMCLDSATLTPREMYFYTSNCIYRGSILKFLGYPSVDTSWRKSMYARVYLEVGLFTPCRVIYELFTCCDDVKAATTICCSWVVEGHTTRGVVSLVMGVIGMGMSGYCKLFTIYLGILLFP